jgi:hypothetical protein
MPRGIRYPILSRLEKEYKISLSNKELEHIAALNIQRTYSARRLYMLISYMGVLPTPSNKKTRGKTKLM